MLDQWPLLAGHGRCVLDQRGRRTGITQAFPQGRQLPREAWDQRHVGMVTVQAERIAKALAGGFQEDEPEMGETESTSQTKQLTITNMFGRDKLNECHKDTSDRNKAAEHDHFCLHISKPHVFGRMKLSGGHQHGM